MPVLCTRALRPGLARLCRPCSTLGHYDTSQFRPQKAVILTKVSRYEFEKLRHDSLTEKQLEQELTARGSNYAAIRHHHNIHKSLEVSVVEALERAGLETRVVKRNQEYTDELVRWASATNRSIGSTTGCTITEKAPTRAFSWLKGATTAFTFKTLLRHNAKWAFN